jgi:hypothetical protein
MFSSSAQPLYAAAPQLPPSAIYFDRISHDLVACEFPLSVALGLDRTARADPCFDRGGRIRWRPPWMCHGGPLRWRDRPRPPDATPLELLWLPGALSPLESTASSPPQQLIDFDLGFSSPNSVQWLWEIPRRPMHTIYTT